MQSCSVSGNIPHFVVFVLYDLFHFCSVVLLVFFVRCLLGIGEFTMAFNFGCGMNYNWRLNSKSIKMVVVKKKHWKKGVKLAKHVGNHFGRRIDSREQVTSHI